MKRRSAARTSTSSPRARSRASGRSGVGSAADHQVDVRREVLQQERHAVADVGPVDQVVVVEHQVNVVRCGREFVEHRGEDGLDRRLGRLQEREHARLRRRAPPSAGR